ncbi:restriction endonuclease subunit S [Iocasia frigidifontis]|nr:restriction endonuclease subunit S [Iocasia fonsfrigidae]
MGDKIPELRFNGFEDKWEEHLFKDFTKLSQGLQIAIDKRFTEPGKNREFYITNEFLKPESKTRYYIESPSINVVANKEDVLMTRTGNTGEIVTDVKGAFHNNFFKIDYCRTVVKKNFLYYFLNSSRIQKEILARAGSSTIPDLNHNDFYKIVAFLPSLAEQNKIGYLFKELDQSINYEQQKLKKLKQLKLAMLQKMFPKEGEKIPEIRFNGFEGDWDEALLGECGETYTGLSGKTKNDFGHGNAEYVTYLSVFNNPILYKNGTDRIEIDSNQNEVMFGDVIFTISSETPGEVGMASVWHQKRKNIYLNSFCFGYRPQEEFNNFYLGYVLRTNLVRSQFIKLAQGVSRYNISKHKAMNIEFPITSIKEQEKIGKFFKELDENITSHQNKLKKLKQFKQAMLQKMFVANEGRSNN